MIGIMQIDNQWVMRQRAASGTFRQVNESRVLSPKAKAVGQAVSLYSFFRKRRQFDRQDACPTTNGLERDKVKKWLSDMDSNHDKGLQRALCYHYTIGQTAAKLDFLGGARKIKRFVVWERQPDG